MRITVQIHPQVIKSLVIGGFYKEKDGIQVWPAHCIQELPVRPMDPGQANQHAKLRKCGVTHVLILPDKNLKNITESTELAKPNTEVCLFFVVGEGAKDVLGCSAGSWCFIHNNKLYKRATHTDMGKKGAGCGLRRIVNGQLNYFLIEIDNKPLVEKIMKEWRGE